MSVNKVILVGHLGKDPELRYTSSQMAIAKFSLATNDRKKDQASGQWVDYTEWHNITCFGKVAENCGQYLKKGRQVYIEGKIKTDKWQDKEGKDRYTTGIIGDTVQFLGSKGAGASEGYSEPSNIAANGGGFESAGNNVLAGLSTADSLQSTKEVSFNDDDIPF